MKTEKQLRRFVNRELLDRPVRHDPLAAGELDSLAIEQLILFIEDTYGVAFEDEELVMENFASLATVSALVDRKRTAPA